MTYYRTSEGEIVEVEPFSTGYLHVTHDPNHPHHRYLWNRNTLEPANSVTPTIEECTMKPYEIMQAHDHGAPIEVRAKGSDVWTAKDKPAWNWGLFDYRVALTVPDSINWDHVAPAYKYMARDENGMAYLFVTKPEIPAASIGYWCPTAGYKPIDATAFASFKPGTVDWKESLVCRP